MSTTHCDTETGACGAPALEESTPNPTPAAGTEVIYVGDPMCSWCWGLSPALLKLRDHCERSGLGFRVVVGGLRPGGGDAWTAQFKDFLRHHWNEIHERSGQPFSHRLFDLPVFEYDTEPACRAVVAARPWLKERELAFFEAVQRKFYVDNEDPKQPGFYESICTQFGLDYEQFLQRFSSEEARQQTLADFRLNRSWGVRAYPSVLLRKGEALTAIAVGFDTFEQMRDRISRA
jgi:putative protein-disulfide isomerase